VVVCSPPSPRALDTASLAGAALDAGVDPANLEVAGTGAEALARALAATPLDGQIVVTGSLYLVGQIRALLAADQAASSPDSR
jgi:dihydrofolate synthase/folylpolyglutamate synthase